MNRGQAELYERIKTYQFDAAGNAGTFRDRLANENGWSPGRAERVIGEYRRFAFLAAAAGHPVSPPAAVDEAWHLHLIHTRAYWEEFCPKVLGKPLHHDPSSGGAGEKKKFADWYARTVESYRRFFGGEPPADIWPRPVAPGARPPAPYRPWRAIRAPFAAATSVAVVAVAIGCGASGSGDAPTGAGIVCAAIGFCALAIGLSAVFERRQRRGRGGHAQTFTQSSSGCGSTWSSCGSATHSSGGTPCDGDSAGASDGGSGSSCGSSCGGSSCGGGGGCGGGGD